MASAIATQGDQLGWLPDSTGTNGPGGLALIPIQSPAFALLNYPRNLHTAGLPRVRADEVMIEQVILNLSNNAIEALAAARPPSPVLLLSSSRQPGEGARVAVIDNGMGMDPEFEKAPFSPFFTTKPEGTGLGLNICRSIIEAHGGHLRFEHNEPSGCIFHFSLPLAN